MEELQKQGYKKEIGKIDRLLFFNSVNVCRKPSQTIDFKMAEEPPTKRRWQ